jgi:predicted small integral membrane protein
MDWMTWMAWTTPSAIFFIGIACILVSMTCWEILSPNLARKGFLPIITTRGDRLFISLLSAAFIHLGVVGFTEVSIWVAFGVAIIWLFIVMKWG